jgi:hypothetical protein
MTRVLHKAGIWRLKRVLFLSFNCFIILLGIEEEDGGHDSGSDVDYDMEEDY